MNESHGLNDGVIMADLMVLQSCGYDNQSYKKWGFSCQNDFDEHVVMLLEIAFSTHRDASLYISQCHIIIQHLIGDNMDSMDWISVRTEILILHQYASPSSNDPRMTSEDSMKMTSQLVSPCEPTKNVQYMSHAFVCKNSHL